MQGLELLWPVGLPVSAEKRWSEEKLHKARSIKMIKTVAYLDPNESGTAFVIKPGFSVRMKNQKRGQPYIYN